MRNAIRTDAVAQPVGPFSVAVRAADTIYLSGQVAQDPATGRLVDGDVAAQLRRALDNAEAVLKAGGRTLDDVVRVTIFLTNMADFAAVNAAYGERFTPPYPARTTVAVTALPLGAAVEIEIVAR